MKQLAGDYDCIIVGAGTARCLLAIRLSADPRRRVLVLEAGGMDNWIWYHIPVGYLFTIGNPRSDWMFRTEIEPGLNGRALIYPRGKVIGGSSAINAMISMRGQAADYDAWQALGLQGWGWNEVLPIFKRLENHFLGESEHHGIDGGLRVEAPRVSWRVLDAVRAAAVQAGVPAIDDFNCGDNEGVSYFHVNQKRGKRWSTARGFLKPALKRGNLRLEMNVLVERLIIEDGRACGVQLRRAGETFEVRTAGEVILSAGAIGSPQILSLSGIGRHEWLAPLGVKTVLNRRGVGSNLQDHLQQRSIYKVSNVKTLNEAYHSMLGRALMGMDYALRRRGALTMAPSQLGVFMRSDSKQPRANLEFHVQPLSLDKFGDPLHEFPAITLSACNLRPGSRGTVRLRSADPAAAPMIAPSYLSTSEDRAVAADALRATRRIMAQAAMQRFNPVEVLPGPSVSDDTDALADAQRGTYRHYDFSPGGDCKNGPRRGRRLRGRRAPSGSWHRAAAGDRCLHHAHDHLRQYQHAHSDDRRERRADDRRGPSR